MPNIMPKNREGIPDKVDLRHFLKCPDARAILGEVTDTGAFPSLAQINASLRPKEVAVGIVDTSQEAAGDPEGPEVPTLSHRVIVGPKQLDDLATLATHSRKVVLVAAPAAFVSAHSTTQYNVENSGMTIADFAKLTGVRQQPAGPA